MILAVAVTKAFLVGWEMFSQSRSQSERVTITKCYVISAATVAVCRIKWRERAPVMFRSFISS